MEEEDKHHTDFEGWWKKTRTCVTTSNISDNDTQQWCLVTMPLFLLECITKVKDDGKNPRREDREDGPHLASTWCWRCWRPPASTSVVAVVADALWLRRTMTCRLHHRWKHNGGKEEREICLT